MINVFPTSDTAWSHEIIKARKTQSHMHIRQLQIIKKIGNQIIWYFILIALLRFQFDF